ncbi:MAG: hypothetical protein M4579_005611 [Chaenotheca gracillima]|nr:MAG: hypothetical protein M4579_005611 [Chaenotheca gracillima]
MDAQENDDEYTVPLEDQRVFGAGLKRKRVKFVPSVQTPEAEQAHTKPSHPEDVGDYYLSLVLPQEPDLKLAHMPLDLGSKSYDRGEGVRRVCEICRLPISSTSEATATTSKESPHEASLAHQVCLSHSHPPSHLDRSHKGLQYLASFGWDPDDRQGLGASGDGIRFPIKSVVKRDNAGVGIKSPRGGEKTLFKKKEEKLNAKQIRAREEEGMKRRQKLQEKFYGNEELEKYLGSAD